MGFAQNRRGYLGVRFIIVVVLLGMSFVDKIEATRPLKKDQAWVWLESLPRAPVPPSGPSPCTQIPHYSNPPGHCPMIMTMEFSGGRPPHVGPTTVASPPPPPPPPSRVESNE